MLKLFLFCVAAIFLHFKVGHQQEINNVERTVRLKDNNYSSIRCVLAMNSRQCTTGTFPSVREAVNNKWLEWLRFVNFFDRFKSHTGI